MDLALVVTTLGRVERVERLLASLSGRLRPGDSLVIVAQGHRAEIAALTADFDGGDATVVVTGSDRGASRGRNAGVAALPVSGDPLLVFPNDSTWFPEGVLEALRELPDDFAAGAMTVIDEHGPKFELPPAGSPLDLWNVWTVIEMGVLMRRSVFDALGGFDADLGTGARTPWQAGEATDLLLRLRDRRPDLAGDFAWQPASVAIGGISDPHDLGTRERRRKLRAYARGMGRVVARWRYPLWWRVAFTGGGLAFGLRHRDTNAIADGWWVFVGRVEGWLGRPFRADGDPAAVTR